jgi:DNA-binding transcriptional LysR family regulator
MTAQLHNRAIFCFDAVRRHGSVREAARRLNIAASAVNRQVLKLEADLGMKLFERLPDGMELTPAGEILARHAIAVLQDEKRVAGELDALRGLRRGEISLIAVESLNAVVLPTVIGTMAGSYPGIQIRARTAGSNLIPQAVAAGDADLGLAFSLARHPALQQLAVGRFRLGAVLRPDHPLAGESQVTFAACARFPLILPGPDLSIHTLLEPQLRRYRGRLEVLAEIGSLELMKQLTLRQGAIGFQSRLGLEAELAAGQLVHVPLHAAAPMTTELGVYLRQGRSLPVALDAFIAILGDEIQRLEALETLL